jgi:hypothetical protein
MKGPEDRELRTTIDMERNTIQAKAAIFQTMRGLTRWVKKLMSKK